MSNRYRSEHHCHMGDGVLLKIMLLEGELSQIKQNIPFHAFCALSGTVHSNKVELYPANKIQEDIGDYWQFFNMSTFLISAHIFSSPIYKHFAHLGHRYGKLSYLYISKSNYTLKYSRNNIYRAEVILTHWVRDKMAAISQTAYSNAFSCVKICELRLRFLRFELTVFQHWLR